MKKYPLSLSADYCHGWTVANAVREILQNCLDSPAQFEYNFDGDTLELTSKGVELPSSTLLLGNSGKRNDADSVGGHGEGYKIALLVLVREGVDVFIRNGSKLWVPSYEYSELFDCDVLTITEDYLNSNQDLTFVIRGVTDELKSEITHDCLYLQDDIGEVLEGKTGRLLRDIKGKLYVGGLFVTDIPTFEHSYDFKPQYLKLNRDRKSVDGWDLQRNTAELSKEVLDAVEIAELIEKNKADIHNMRHRSDLTEVADALYARLIEKHGDDVVVCNWYDDQEKLEQQGFKNVVNVSHTNYVEIVKMSPKYKEKIEELEEQLDIAEEDERTPVEMMEDWWIDQNSDHFEKLLEVFRNRGVSFDAKSSSTDNLPF